MVCLGDLRVTRSKGAGESIEARSEGQFPEGRSERGLRWLRLESRFRTHIKPKRSVSLSSRRGVTGRKEGTRERLNQ